MHRLAAVLVEVRQERLADEALGFWEVTERHAAAALERHRADGQHR